MLAHFTSLHTPFPEVSAVPSQGSFEGIVARQAYWCSPLGWRLGSRLLALQQVRKLLQVMEKGSEEHFPFHFFQFCLLAIVGG